jgi:hypothetical protein
MPKDYHIGILLHENSHFPLPGESKKNTRESDMLIGTSRQESVINQVVAHCCTVQLSDISVSLEMPVPSQGHYGFPSFPVVD